MAYELNKPGIFKKVKDNFNGSKGLPDELKESEQFFFASLEEQKAYVPVWFRNIALFMGHHWMDWSAHTQFLALPSMPSWKVRMVINLIMPTIRTEAAKILKSNPSIAAVPGNDSDEARQAARIATRVLEAKYAEDDYQRRLYNLTLWFLVCGSSYLWTLWDKTAGRAWSEQIKNPETGELIDAQFFEGDVIDEVTGPFDVLMEPNGPEDFNDHRRIMRPRVLETQFIKDKWGVDVPAETIDMKQHFQFRINSMAAINSAGLFAPRNSLGHRKVTLVKEMFELPSSKWPEGMHAIYANGRVIVPPEPLDYWLRGRRALPVAKFDHITIPGSPYGRSIIEQIGPLNVALNKMTSQAMENANLLSRPKIKAPQGCLDDDSWTDQPGEVIEYRPIGGLGPEPVTPPAMPQYFFQLKDSIPGQIADVSGIFDVSRGKLPRRATSGKAIDLLQDADDTRMGLTIRNFSSSLERSQSIKLELMKRNYKEKRILKKIGPGHSVEVLRFSSADLKDADTVRIVQQPALSRAAKVQIGLKLGEAQLIPPDQVLKIMELGDLNIVYDQDADQINFAKMENFSMSKGEVEEPNFYDIHPLHAKEHEDFLRRFSGKLSPEVVSIIQQHVQIHKEMDAAAGAGGGAPGAPGAPGGGGEVAPPEPGTPPAGAPQSVV